VMQYKPDRFRLPFVPINDSINAISTIGMHFILNSVDPLFSENMIKLARSQFSDATDWYCGFDAGLLSEDQLCEKLFATPDNMSWSQMVFAVNWVMEHSRRFESRAFGNILCNFDYVLIPFCMAVVTSEVRPTQKSPTKLISYRPSNHYNLYTARLPKSGQLLAASNRDTAECRALETAVQFYLSFLKGRAGAVNRSQMTQIIKSMKDVGITAVASTQRITSSGDVDEESAYDTIKAAISLPGSLTDFKMSQFSSYLL